MKRLLPVAMVLCGAQVAEAADFRGTFSTLLSLREATRNGEEIGAYPLVELVALEVDDLGIPGTDGSRVVLQGWGRLQLGDDDLRDTDADLGLMFLEMRSGRTELRVGRQYLSEGVGRMSMIDGANAYAKLWRGLAAQAFVGATVHPQLRHATGSWQLGGRLSWAFHELLGTPATLGLGYRQRRHRGDLRKHHLGADAAVQLGATHWVAVAVVDPTLEALVEGRLALSLRPGASWLVTIDAERVRPALLIPLNSIFSVFADAKHDSIGGDAGYSPSPYFAFDVSGHLLRLDNEQLGYRLFVRAVTSREPSRRSLVGAEVRRAHEDRSQGYLSGRLFTRLQLLEPLAVSADLFVYGYDQPINDTDLAVLGQGSVIVDIAPSMRLAASLAGGTTPWAKTQIEGLLRFAWGWDVHFAREVAP